MTGRLSAALLVLTVAAACTAPDRAGLPYYGDADLTPEWLSEREARNAHVVPSFGLTDQTGRTVTEETLDGRVTVVSFFFSNCAQVCPVLRSNLGTVQERFGGEDRVQIVSHSVMPEYDSAEILAQYAAVNGIDGERWRLVTGERTEIYELARSGYFVDVDDTPGDLSGYDLIHTETVALLDGERRIRGVYTGTLKLEIERLLEDIDVLLAGE